MRRTWPFLPALLLAAASTAQAQFNYTVSNGIAEITSYTGPGGTVTIPPTTNNYTVAIIGTSAFELKPITSVSIPSTVTNVGNLAFACCSSLTNITIPDTVAALGNSAFSNCANLASAVIGQGVIQLGSNVFQSCSKLTNVTLGTNLQTIGDGDFLNCATLPSLAIPNTVTSIGIQAFYGCSGLTNMTIPNGVTSLGNMAFQNCSGLQNLVIPDNLTFIPELCFSGCSSLTYVIIPASVTMFGPDAFINCGNLRQVYFLGNAPYYSSLLDSLLPFYYDKSATAYYQVAAAGWGSGSGYSTYGGIMAKALTANFGADATGGLAPLTNGFYSSTGTDSSGAAITAWNWTFGDGTMITLTNAPGVYTYPGHTYTNAGTFFPVLLATNILGVPVSGSGPSMITVEPQLSYSTINGAITITGYAGPGGLAAIPGTINGLPVTGVAEDAFNGATNLDFVVVPASVTNIGDNAFAGCPSLTQVYFQSNPPVADSTIFSGDTNLTAYYYSASQGWGATYCSIPTAVLAATYTTTPTNGMAPLLVSFNVSAVDTGGNPICGCNWYFGDVLSSVLNPSHLYTQAGTWYPSLTAVNSLGLSVPATGPSSVTVTPLEYNFSTATGSVSILSGGGTNAVVVIPSVLDGLPVTAIGSNAFGPLSSLSDITFPNTLTSIGDKAFSGCLYLTNVIIPASVTNMGYQAFASCGRLRTVTISNSITNGNYAFQGCGMLGNLTIAPGVTSIGSNEFPSTYTFASLVIPASVNYIGASAFSGSELRGAYFLGSEPTAVDNKAFSGVPASHVFYLPGATGWSNSIGGLPPMESSLHILSATPGTGVAPLRVAFTSDICDFGYTLITNWNWSFGDGSTSTASNPSHTYTNAGTFHPTLLATNSLGFPAVNSATWTITVAPPPSFAGCCISNTDLTLSGSNGLSGATYYLLTSTDVTLPLSQWTPVATNVLSAPGNFSFTVSNALGQNSAQQYYILQSP